MDPNTQIHVNLDGVDVWGGVQRAARGGTLFGPTDWELLEIKQRPESWGHIQWWKDGKIVENPFQ